VNIQQFVCASAFCATLGACASSSPTTNSNTAGSTANDIAGGGETTAAVDASSAADTASRASDAAGKDTAAAAPTELNVSDEIKADTKWTADHVYILKKHIFVSAGTLTIEPGVTVRGGAGTSLVIMNTAKIHAVGTAEKPIVLTSAKPEGARVPGDWGGLVLLGKAPINVTGGTSKIECFPAGVVGTDFGGTDPKHDCGKLKYVRIEYAGFELTKDNELNSLSLGACGSDTEIDFVQTHMGSDDGIECFGGTVNLKHIVVSQCLDDHLDWDFGWQGKVQYAILQQSVGSNQGIEGDNNKNDNDATPRSGPTIYNATLVGSDVAPGKGAQQQMGMHLRRGTAARLYNFIVAHFADFPIDVDGKSTVAQTPKDLFVKNSIFFDNGAQEAWADAKDNDGGFDEGKYFKAEPTVHLVDPKLTAATDQTKPNFMPMAGSPALDASKAATPPADGFFNDKATFIGAMGPTDWTAGWTAFPAQ
jgi:hypothetical protein